MLWIRVLVAYNIILFGSFHGECAAVHKDNTFNSTDKATKNYLIEAQSIGRIVNRVNQKEIHQNILPPPNYIADITRTSSTDAENPCPIDVPQLNAAPEAQINGNPSATYISYGSQVNTQSTYSSDFQLQIQSPRPVQHIHYHYIVPNTTPKPIVNYVTQSQSDFNAHNVNSDGQPYSSNDPRPSHIIESNLQHSNREVMSVNPLYSAVDNGGFLYDSPDEHQGQASENTSVYEFRDPGQTTKDELQSEEALLKTSSELSINQPISNHQMDVVSPIPNQTEVYFIKYYDEHNKTTTSPESQIKMDTSSEVSDGSGLIDIRAGIAETLEGHMESTTPYNEYSAYNVPLN
ncbi:uncharacterized protein LOC117142993 [Drosophila mauritiana]|uniref:Uncharacterized protein LOC117142993 n=1 Tax=Drosophila mauritiana TaxID=7226 RepID=A0A6P8K390_DROMA|nr:uncharacterized protein LOC117142993 [Drosophila mauritiana]